MICPILTAARQTHATDKYEHVDCELANCGWWDPDLKQCAEATKAQKACDIAYWLEDIALKMRERNL